MGSGVENEVKDSCEINFPSVFFLSKDEYLCNYQCCGFVIVSDIEINPLRVFG